MKLIETSYGINFLGGIDLNRWVSCAFGRKSRSLHRDWAHNHIGSTDIAELNTTIRDKISERSWESMGLG